MEPNALVHAVTGIVTFSLPCVLECSQKPLLFILRLDPALTQSTDIEPRLTVFDFWYKHAGLLPPYNQARPLAQRHTISAGGRGQLQEVRWF